MGLEGRQHAGHPFIVTGPPDDRVPVGVEQEDAPARAQHAPDLVESAGHVVDVLEDLGRHHGVERGVGVGQVVRISGSELDRGTARHLGAGVCDRQHAVAHVDSADPAGRTHLRGHLRHQQAGADADIENALPRTQAEGDTDDAALLDDVGGGVHGLDPPRGRVVELQCRHDSAVSRGFSRRSGRPYRRR
jgi:hypothetical protein